MQCEERAGWLGEMYVLWATTSSPDQSVIVYFDGVENV